MSNQITEDIDETLPLRLTQQKEYLIQIKRSHQQRIILNRILVILGALFIIATPIYYFSTSSSISLLGFIYGLLFMIIPILRPLNRLESLIRETENEIDLMQISMRSVEQRSEKQFRLHQFEIKRYYDLTLNHSTKIFWVGLACLILGFSFIGISIYLIIKISPEAQLASEIIVGTLAAIGTILSNYIASIYIKMYSENISSLTEFHNRLVFTHHLHFGNVLTAKIKDEDIYCKTLSEMAINLTKK